LARQQRAAEQLRQLYVATTRPRRALHLVGQVTLSKEGAKQAVKLPRSGSLLRALWDVVAEAFAAAAIGAVPPAPRAEAGAPLQRFRRLPKAWQAPDFPAAIAALPAPAMDDADDYIPFDWVGQTTRVVGIVVHRLLQRIAEEGIERYAQPLLEWDPDQPDVLPVETKVDARVATKRAARIASLWPAAEALLVKEGLAESARAAALAAVKQAITRTLEDPAGRWILSPHPRAASELELSVAAAGQVAALRIDRAFGQGTKRWVVDFKASSVEGSGIERFLEQQGERYAAQLARYAAATGEVNAPAKSALYFPQLSRLKR
jgi:ATP-dependent exoDNAse (exonuclease V) beta subunit